MVHFAVLERLVGLLSFVCIYLSSLHPSTQDFNLRMRNFTESIMSHYTLRASPINTDRIKSV